MRPQTLLTRAVELLYHKNYHRTGNAAKAKITNLFTTALSSSETSKYISLLLCLTPAFLQGIGDENGVDELA